MRPTNEKRYTCYNFTYKFIGDNMPGGKEKKKRITIRDIANAVGIAPSSVSKALNDLPTISENMKTLVRAKARELNYKHIPMLLISGGEYPVLNRPVLRTTTGSLSASQTNHLKEKSRLLKHLFSKMWTVC